MLSKGVEQTILIILCPGDRQCRKAGNCFKIERMAIGVN